MGVWKFPAPGGVTLEGQGATEDEARTDALRRYNATLENPLKLKQQAGQDFVGRIKAGLVERIGGKGAGGPAMGDPRDPSFTRQAVAGAANAVLPGSWEEAVIQTAMLGTGKIAGAAESAVGKIPLVGKVAAPVAGAAAQVGAPAAAGAGAAALKGGSAEDVAGAAETGAIAGAIPASARAVSGAVGAFTNKFGHLETQGFLRRVRDQLAPKLGDAIEADIPSLRGRVNSTGDIMRLLDEPTGRKILGNMFDTTEGQIKTTLANRQVVVSDEARQLATKTLAGAKVSQEATGRTIEGVEGGRVQGTPMNADEAIRLSKSLRDKSLRTAGGDSRVYREASDEVLNSILTEVRGVEASQQRIRASAGRETTPTQSLADKYEGLRQDYSKFMDLREFLSKRTDRLFPALTKGGASLDLVEWGDRLVQNLDDVSPSRFPHLHSFFSGGEELGTRPRSTQYPLVSKGRLGETIPGTKIRAYEGGRLEGVAVPEGLRTTSPIRKTLETTGRVGGAVAVPSIRQQTQD